MENKLYSKLICPVVLLIVLCFTGCYFYVYDIVDVPEQATAWTPLYLDASVKFNHNYLGANEPDVHWSIKNAGTTKAKIAEVGYKTSCLLTMAPGTVLVSASAEGFSKDFTITVLPAPEEIHTLGTELISKNVNTAKNPVLLKIKLNLEVHWKDLMNMLSVADRYVNLDLAESTGTQIPDFSGPYSENKVMSIVLPESIISIGDSAFSYCKGLTSISLGNNVLHIGDYAFSNCNELTDILIPDSVTSIGDYAFYNCKGLTSISLGNSVSHIGNYVFYNCDELSGILIPDSVISIGNSVFAGCSNLTAIDVAPGNAVYTSIDGILYNKTATSLIRCPIGKTGTIKIPDTVTGIEADAFESCAGLISVNIPDSVLSIGNYAFGGCTSLASVIIGNKVETIGASAFRYCTNLASVNIPDSVLSIGNYAFDNCNRLVRVTFNGAITQDGFDEDAFYPGDLRLRYFANSGGQGTYTRTSGSDRWSKE